MQIIGCDFSSSPKHSKPIVVAISAPTRSSAFSASIGASYCTLQSLERFDTAADFAAWLKEDRIWVGSFDLPFGLPRELVESLGWPTTWEACIRFYAKLSREDVRTQFKAFCDSRPSGAKFAHRATDRPAGSSPSMKWVNPPVAYMLHAGCPMLVEANCHIPGLRATNSGKVALEGYPGLLAREMIGTRSYKSDDRAKQTADRLIARKDILTGLETGHTRLAVRLKLSNAQRDTLIGDGSGDSLDAVLCMVQAHWAHCQHLAGHANYGLPPFDPLEGWIVTA